jgi:anti-sigma factor RsiW
MNAHLTDEQAQSLVDGLLPARVREACQAHAGACAECGVLVASYVALGEALGDLDAPLPPPDFTDVVMDRIEAHEHVRVWERRLAVGILGAAACGALLIFALAGVNAWAPVVSRISDALGGTVRALSIGADVFPPLLRALRLQISVACGVVGFPLFYALSRLVPRSAEANA